MARLVSDLASARPFHVYGVRVRICVLGSSRAAAADGVWLDLGSRKPRAVVAALAMRPGMPVAADLLADLVWGGEPPRAAHGALHAYISGLRKALEPDRPARGAASVLETTDHGYVLRVADGDVDTRAFAADVREADRALAPLASQLDGGRDASWPDRTAVLAAIDRVDAALASWTGEPYADLPEHPDVVADRASLEQVRAAAEESRLLGLLALGDHASVLSATEAAIGRQVLRERLWAIHALALTRSGRQADALAALRTVRGVLADELGLDPGAELRGLEDRILRQDEVLHATLARPVVEPSAPTTPPAASLSPGAAADEGIVGRDQERAALARVVGRAAAGSLGVAQLVGEPGIGKTRLTEDLVVVARTSGVRTALGRCSQDDGAPPLWPWRQVLRDLGVPDDALRVPDDADASPEQRAFRTAELVAGAVLDAAAGGPVLVVLDDLHWADAATLRTLAHLLAVAPADAALAVVVTRRTHPEPTGPLALVGEALARRPGVRLDLSGLDVTEAGSLARSVGGDAVAPVVAEWHARSGGNPFFLIELARLGPSDAEGLPGTVRDVVTRRLDDLPPPVLATLETAAVVGRRFHALTVARADDRDLDEVVDNLEAARVAGLVGETGVEEFAFSHALTRDAVAARLTGTRAARRHARVAHALAHRSDVAALHTDTERTAELARHWLAAGSSHVDTAWRAARDAADQARRLTSFAEAMDLRQAAVDAHRRTAGADDRVRYELLLELAADAAYAGRWTGVEAASLEAMALGRALASPELVGRAAAGLTLYCVWSPHETGVVVEDAVDDLRWALAHVSDDDPAARARIQLSLAVELYYDPDHRAESEALVTSGLAIARRTGDRRLLWWAARAAWSALWMPHHTERRLDLSAEGLAAAREVGDRAAEAVLLVGAAVDALELARRDEWVALAGEAERIGRRERLPYVLLTLAWLRTSLAAIGGDEADVARHHAELARTAPLVAVPHQELQAAASLTLSALWAPERLRGLAAQMREAQAEHGMGATLVHSILARTGTAEELAEALVAMPVEHEPVAYWATLGDWVTEAESAAVVGDQALARRALEVLAPYSGRLVVTGAVLTMGPVDGYLALVHATLGDPGVARRHADAAHDLAVAWEMDAYVTWLDGHRERLGIQ